MKFEKYLFVFVYDRDKGDESMDTGDTVKPEKDDEFYGEHANFDNIYNPGRTCKIPHCLYRMVPIIEIDGCHILLPFGICILSLS